MPLLKLLLLGFVAGFVATLLFHQSLWYLFNQLGVIPPDRPAWPLDAVPPLGRAIGNLQGVFGVGFGARVWRCCLGN